MVKSLAISVCAAFALVLVTLLPANAQWRATAWTLDFTNNTEMCVSLVIAADGEPVVDKAIVWAHRNQHFDDNHLGVTIHAKIFEHLDCTGKFVADLHQPMHQLRNIVSVEKDGAAFAMHREETQDLNSYNTGITANSVDRESDADVQFGPPGPAYRVQTFAVANVHLGDDLRAVSAVAAANHAVQRSAHAIAFTTADGAIVNVDLRADPHGTLRAWKIATRFPTATPPAAARYVRAALSRYGQQPTTQQSGTYIMLHYCTTARIDPTSHLAVACEGAGPTLEVLGSVPESHVELK